MHRRIVGVALVLFGMSAAGVALLAQTTVTGPTQMERCDEALFAIAFTNPSPTQTACQIVFVNTAPSAEFPYVPGSGSVTLHTGTIYHPSSLGSWNIDSIVGVPYELPPGGTVTVQFRLSTTCLAVSGTDSVRVDYVDCRLPGTPLQALDSKSVEILPGAVTVTKTPSTPAAGVGDLVIWTLGIHSTGLGSIKNVAATDVLGSGLAYVSSSPTGSRVGQTITWNSAQIPGLADMDKDTTIEITLTARVIACSGLENRLDARFGCATGQVCDDTVTDPDGCGCGTATSSVAFIERLPFLTFSAPTITIPYCAATTTVSIPITNSGDGTAHDGSLGANLGSSLVVSSVVGATYDVALAHFDLPDIPAPLPPALAYTHTLTFNVTYTGLWCSSAPSGTPLFQLDYENDCGVTHLASPQYGSIGATAAPTLSVSKTGPAILTIGDRARYPLTVTYTNPGSCPAQGDVTVTDTVPDGYRVTDATSDGTYIAGQDGFGGSITWTFNPNTVPVFERSPEFEVRGTCSPGPCHTTQTNRVEASVTDCCGCSRVTAASASTAIICDILVSSDLTVVPSILERCGPAASFSDVHVFSSQEILAGISFDEFAYFVRKDNGLTYVGGSASATIVDGGGTRTPTVTVTNLGDRFQFLVNDTGSVQGSTLTFVYQMQATEASQPACGGSGSFYVWVGHSMPSIGPCTEFYDTRSLTVAAPAMSVGIAGVPTIQEDCATYNVTITFQRASSLADPYDARLVLTGTSGVIADFAGATWSGITPSEPAIVGSNTVEWRFADEFTAAGATATLTVPVTAKCGGPLIGLAATGHFDDLCNNTAGYNDTCSTSASASSSLRLTGDIYISKTPEVVYTTLRTVTWRIELYNASNGTAYNVYVDDVLGSGLAYALSSASGYSGALTTQANLNHTGGAINGASFLFERIAPGERPVITFTADLVACSNMTNTATVGWGCGGDACQPTRSDSSYVLVAPANVVSTSFAPTPIDACTTEKATITLRSAGIATAYDLIANVTLPTGLVYVGNPEVRIGAGSWLPAGAPTGAPGPTLSWDQAQISALAAVATGVTIEVRFDVSANCSFNGGNLQVQTGYENPCGQTFTSAVGTFALATRKPTLSLSTSQTSPAAGQPIPCGGDVTWEIRVTNSGPATATAVWVEETLGAGLTYASSAGGADGGSNVGQVTTWEILNLGVGSTAVLTITAHATSCNPLTNSVKAYWACGPDGTSATTPDCLSSTFASASATATRAVSVTAAASMSPISIGSCETQKTLTVTLSNTSTSVAAYNPDIRLTLPTGLTYRAGTTETNCGSGFTFATDPQQAGQVLTWYSLSSTGTGNDLCASIPASGSVAVRFQVDAACYRTTATATLDLYYYDCCGATQYHVVSSPSLPASSPTLSVTMTPSTAALDCANPSSTVTWTITVNNTGGATAGFVRIIDTLGADLVRTAGGTQIGANPLQWGWEIGPLASGGSQSVTLTARLASPPNDCSVARRTSTAVTTWGCAASIDSNPNTTTEYSCTSSGGPNTQTVTVLVPDLTVTDVLAACNLDDTFTVSASVRNTGGQAANNVSIRVYADGTLVHDETQSIASGATYSLSYVTPPLLCATPHAIRVVADEPHTICECVETNNEATVSAALCPCPALSTQKSITNVWRNGVSIWPTAAVESGDVIEYEAVIANNGAAIAFHVDLIDALPSGLVYHAAAPGHGGQYTLSSGGSGTFAAPVGGSTFAMAIHATLAIGQSMTLRYCALALSSLQQGDILTNIIRGDGQEGNGAEIPAGIASATIGAHRPGLKVDKTITDVVRDGVSRSIAGPVEPGDVIVYRFVVRNVGLGTAYGVGVSEALPTGLVIETVPPGSAGAYTVTAPAASGSLSLIDGASAFTAPIGATIAGGGSLTATYAARVTSSAVQGVSLVNEALALGVDDLGAPIPEANAAVGDTSDDDVEDSDADDTGIASVGVAEPALSVNKVVVDVRRGGVSLGVVDPVLYGDVVVYHVTVRNVGLGMAYGVDLVETPPVGFVVDTSTPYGAGTFTVDSPTRVGSLGLGDGAMGLSTAIGATIAGGGTLTATYAARILPYAPPSVPAVNSVRASGVDGAGSSIPGANPALGDTSDDDAEDSDADDTGIASVRVGAPALVTAKRIDRIVRDGNAVVTGAAEPGDILTYVLVARNVGQGPAFDVSLVDTLPTGFGYRGSTNAVWPSGSSTVAPAGIPGPTLSWPLAATLDAGEEIVLSFEATVPSSVRQGTLYTNVMSASGRDGAGAPIPADSSVPVPEDDDLDDSSDISVVAAEPALVTDKRVVDVARSGLSLGPITTIETGDVITFELAVTNVGLGTAYAVDVHDDLPPPLAYTMGSTTCTWPLLLGTLTVDPLGAPGSALWWTTNAKLATGDTLVFRFRAVVDGPVRPGATYRNVLTANGVDGGSFPIPANNSVAVARDTDFDDSDAVALSGLADAPALVTQKGIVAVFRSGQPSHDQRVEVGDVVSYETVVENVGTAVAFNVDVTDALPGEFEYIFGSTVASTPSGFSAADPVPAPGGLLFRLGATLAYRERAVVRFDARVIGPIFDGRVYVNVMETTGLDETGTPIPADQRSLVPADIDRDDTSSASIVGRSWLLEGMGGSINVPILRKSAETLGAGPCSGTATVVDRVWFQTDIAMLAASEFAAFAAETAVGDVFPDTLLPTWARTVRTDLKRYADSNLLQVDVLSSVGVDLVEGPRIVAAAGEERVTADEAAAHRLAELGRLAGVSASDLVPDGTWIYLEVAGGEPVYIAARDTAWGTSGTWRVLDEGIVGSSLGMSLVRQAQAAGSLLASTRADERYVGWVLAELMANKLVALNRDLAFQPEDGLAYVPHIRGRTADAGRFDVVDGSSVLFDQLSLAWGAARVLSLVEAARDAWPESERELALALESEARTLLKRTAEAIAAYHLNADGQFVSQWPAATDGSPTDSSTVDLGLLVVATREARPLAADLDQILSRIEAAAIAQLISRQGADGRFVEVSSTAGVPTELAAQFAGIYGLLAAGDRERADLAFDFLEREAWDDVVGFGLYRLPADDGVMPCYTALDMGLAVAALRELAAESEPERGALIIRRLAAFARSVLDDAALELDNAQLASTTKIVPNAGRGTLSGLTVRDGVQLSPVLQRSLCLVETAAAGSCSGLRVLSHDPWYQTDIAMYASYVLQASSLSREDDADANLVAVDFHSGLGVSFDAVASLADVAHVAADIGSQATIDPIVVPYFAGDPTLADGDVIDLAWNPASFDTRIVPSALGMTLLREAQETAQLAAKTDRDADDDLAARVLAASIVGKLDVLEDLVTVGPGGTSYVSHAFAARLDAEKVQMVATDRTSVLFDQISLLLGLTETYSLLGNAAATDLFAIQSADAAALAARAEALVDIVLETLEIAHLRPLERALADLATPAGTVWTPGDEISASYLGLAAEAFEQVIGAFGSGHRLANRARVLLEDEVSFLRRALWDGSGGARDLWVADEVSPTCSAPTLTGQLGALRALLAADRVLGSAAKEIRSALLAFDSRFWDPEAEVYVGVLDHLAWCMTPLDFAMVVNVVPQATSFLGAADAQVVNSHLVRHVDRALDAVDLQIPARTLDEEGRERLFAPVFDRRVCLEPVSPFGDLSWTRAGDFVRYAVEVENPTDETFLALTLDDLLPEGVSLVGTSPTVTAVGGRALRWTFDRLAPGEVREWTIDVRVDDGRGLGETLTNCATLTYTDAAGESRPTREACADVTLGTADDARSAALRSTSVTYRTDQAMRLAVALEDLADQGDLGTAEADARAASLANLGILLGESGLGVPFSLAPIWEGTETSSERLAVLAETAKLPGVPSLGASRLGAPIFLPSSGGVPILDRGEGFIDKTDDITPAALGWTLAREMQFLKANAEVRSGLAATLAGFVSLVVDGQVAWLEEAVRLPADGAYFVHGMTPERSGDGVSYNVSDPRSLAYDQAALLLGLVRAAVGVGVDPQTARLAAELADGVFLQLGRHIGVDGTLVASLTDSGRSATWVDTAVAVRALSEAAATLPGRGREREAKAFIASLAGRAREAQTIGPTEEAARIGLLLVAGRALGDNSLSEAGLAAWRTFAATSLDSEGRLVVSSLARMGWRYSPAEAALAFELLGDVARADPSLAAESALLAADILLVDVLEERVQLRTALGYWTEHVGIACFDAAPVFAVRIGPIRGDEPLWTLRRP